MGLVGGKTTVRRSRMNEFIERGRREAYRRNVQTVEAAEPVAHRLCPKDSGDLDSTIRVEKNPRRMRAALKAGGIAKSGRDVDYAGIVEADQPFIKPAMALALSRSRNRPFRMKRG